MAEQDGRAFTLLSHVQRDAVQDVARAIPDVKGGYSYSSQSTHVASIVLRHLVGMELQEYLNQRLAIPMEWGRWSWARTRDGKTLPHTPGGADIAVRSTDALRFAYLRDAV